MSKSETNGVTRRGLLGGLGAGIGVAGLAALSPAQAALLPEPETSENYDLVIIGSGLTGCAAALEAASRGAKVAVLEKESQSRMGGNSFLAGGSFSLPLSDDPADRLAYVEDYERYTLGRGNSEIFALMAEHIHADVAWLQANGVEVLPAVERPPNRVATATVAPGSFVGMPVLFRRMRALFQEQNVDLVFDTKAKQLIMDEAGGVIGVRAVGREGVVDYRARSIVIATGGYAGNSAMLEAYSDPNAGALMVRGIEHATGDGLLMAQAAGAGLKGMGGLMALHIAAVDGVETAAGQPAAVVPYAVSINREGRRFVDESLGYVSHGKAVLGQPGQMTTLVFDQQIRESVAEAVIATFNRLGLTVHQSDTLQGLAEQVGLPVDQFVQTIEEFNAAVADGAAPSASPPKGALATKIETAPFYAFSPLVPGITLTFGGIMINRRTQVLEADGRVIPGLFAAGEGAGAVFFQDYIGGGSMTNCLVMGRIAGREAATATASS